MQAQFKVLSLSHAQAPLATRELFHLNPDQCRSLAMRIHEVLGLEEVMVVSTCNRTELYVTAEGDLSHPLAALLCMEKGIANPGKHCHHFQWISESDAAVRHLFEVSMGLHSQVIGDIQIGNQVKQAYAASAELKLAGPFLHRLMHTIFHANKRVQQETAYRDGAASLSYCAALLARELSAAKQSPSALVIGLGEMGRDVARNLAANNFGRVAVVNRTDAKAEEFAQAVGVEWIPFANLGAAVREFGVVICAVGGENPLITPALLMDAGAYTFNQRYFIDLSMPRAVSPAVDQIPGVLVYDLDELRCRTDETVRRRMEAVPRVKALIDEELTAFLDWSRELTISPAIQKLKDALEQIRQEEMGRYLRSAQNATEADLVDKVTKSMMNKIIKLPVLQLKAACKRGEQESMIDVLNDLFDLEKARAAAKSENA